MASAAVRGRPAIIAKTELSLGNGQAAAVRLVNEGKTVQIEFPTGWDVLQVGRSTTKAGVSTRVKFVAQSLDLVSAKDKATLDLDGGKSLTAALVGDGQSVLVTLPDGWDVDSFTRSPITDGGRTKATFTSTTQTKDQKIGSNGVKPTAAEVADAAPAKPASKAPAKRSAAKKAPAAKVPVPATPRTPRARSAKKAASKVG